MRISIWLNFKFHSINDTLHTQLQLHCLWYLVPCAQFVKAYTKLSRNLEMSCSLIVNDLDYTTRLFLFIESTSSVIHQPLKEKQNDEIRGMGSICSL